MKKRVLMIGLCLLMCSSTVFAESEVSVETEVTSTAIVKEDFSPQLIEKIKVQRNTIYNALNLTPAQIKKNEEIEQKRYEALEPELRNLCLVRKKLKTLQSDQNSNKKEIRTTEKELNKVKNNIKNISNNYDKQFKEILTSDQKAKYNMIRKLKKSDLKKLEKSKNGKETPSDLRPFGKPISQAAYTEEMKKKNSFWYKIKNRRKK